MLWTRKSLVLALLALAFSIVIASLGTASFVSVIAQTNSAATVYLGPPIINGTEIGVGQNFTVNLNIVDAVDIYSWQAGLIFNATALECLNFMEGEFLKDVAPGNTQWIEGTINNTLGAITPYSSTFLGDYKASGDGRLAYLTFRVKAPGVSDLHLRDVFVEDYHQPMKMVPFNIIDIFTVFVNATPHTVVTVSNSTGWERYLEDSEYVTYHSGFYDHAFSASLEEVSFKVTGPYPGWSNVTIPEALLTVDSLDEWKVIRDNIPVSRTVTYNGTHYSIYFTYSKGIHEVRITARSLFSSTITITLSSTSINLGSNITISGSITADTTVRENVTVTIRFRPSGTVDGWETLPTVKTDQNGNYSYIWTPEKAGTYEVMAIWDGDANTEGDETDQPYPTLTVKEAGIDPYIIAAAAVAIIIIVAIVVYYFVKIRKPEEEE